MTTIKLSTWKLNRREGNSFEAEPMNRGPSKLVEIASVDDAKRELNKFTHELKETGKPWVAFAGIYGRGQRAPRGFNVAVTRNELQAFVNDHLCGAA